jgi:branched-chain amino acid transport system permease protein
LAAYGGDDGYTLYGRTTVLGRRWLEDRLAFHFIALGALALAWLLCRAWLASRTGRVLRAARESEIRVAAVGLSVLPHRLAAYVLAGAIGGLAGLLLANATEFVAPSYLTWQRSGELLFMVILGGAGSLTGAIFGALAYVALEEGLSHVTEHWRIGFGVLLVVAAVRFRGGLAGLFGGRA